VAAAWMSSRPLMPPAGSAIRRHGDRLPDQSGEADEHGDGQRDNEVAADQDVGDAAGDKGGNQPAEHVPLDRHADGDQGESGEEADGAVSGHHCSRGWPAPVQQIGERGPGAGRQIGLVQVVGERPVPAELEDRQGVEGDRGRVEHGPAPEHRGGKRAGPGLGQDGEDARGDRVGGQPSQRLDDPRAARRGQRRGRVDVERHRAPVQAEPGIARRAPRSAPGPRHGRTRG
jgi:hypothetical protein